ncbi:NEL-type E3 ubiquitin ligase domain-containing protein [Pseudomonas prosekii]|nr:NEL-type E3 ubiquitin ligase domain-containing protein [Pseudomonas prosekii]
MDDSLSSADASVTYTAQRRNATLTRERIQSAIEAARGLGPPTIRLASEAAQVNFPDWYLRARKIDREYFEDLFGRRWLLQGQLDELIGGLQQDMHQFAEPLLIKALKETLNLNLDVRATELHLYIRDTVLPGIDLGASRVRQTSLLDAALHNFEADEAKPDAFRDGSGIFTRDDQGQLVRHSLAIAPFVTLCRRLDLGAKYQAHLTAILQPPAAAARRQLQEQSVATEKAAFAYTALRAVLKGDITYHAYACLLKVHDATPDRRFYGVPMLNHRLSLMGFKISGVTLFSAVAEPGWAKKATDVLSGPLLKWVLGLSRDVPILPSQDLQRIQLLKDFFANGPKGVTEAMARQQDTYAQSHLAGNLIVYIPDDPDHPLKEYASFTEFMKMLVSQLRRPHYQKFFKRFVRQQDQGLFIARARERFSTFTWRQLEPLDMGPWWRQTAVENPDPEPVTNVITGDLWSNLHTKRLDKLIADARQLAVPTDDEDAQSRWKRLSSYLSIGWNVFNFAAMLVPGVGEAVLAVMAAQFLEELVEGLEDWRKGDRDEAAGHLVSVLINGAQLAMMGAGHVLPARGLTAIKPSPVLDGLRPVQLPDGQLSLWQPDLQPYDLGPVLAQDSRANELGLHAHQGNQVLRLENQHFNVSADPASAEHCIEHPTRSNAYRPKLSNNGIGGWLTELDKPLTWDPDKVWQRLGHSLEKLPVERQTQIRTVSGVDHTVLRRMYAEQEAAPAILVDTLRRFQLYADVQGLAEQILENNVAPSLEGFLPTFITELPRWPESRAVEVFDSDALSGASSKSGNLDATAAQTLKISRAQLRAGKLTERVLDALDEDEIHALLGRQISPLRAERLKALRARLAMHAGRQTRRVFDSMYALGDVSEPRQLLLQQEFSTLPEPFARQILEQASHDDVQFIEQKSRLPLRLKTQARETLHEVRVSRAYEGLYLDGLATADSDRLALHSAAALPGWSNKVRIEVREGSFNGVLRDSVGAEDAAVRKVLVENGDGSFEARDSADQHLHGADDLFAALLHALPDEQRTALGFEISQGAQLRAKVFEQPLSREVFSTQLRQTPLRKPAYDPQTMKLRGGMPGGFRFIPGEAFVRDRLQSLYRGFEELDVDRIVDDLYRRNIPLQQHVTALEDEFNTLCHQLHRWQESPTEAMRFSPAGVAQWQARNRLAKMLRQCWQRTGPRGVEVIGEAHPQALDFRGMPMDRHLRTFPTLEANFDHVTSLSLRDTGVFSGQMQFLGSFRGLRLLNLADNLLTELPEEIAHMRHLNDLILGRNQITLTPDAVARLRSLTGLRSLSLSENPLGLAPDISQMRHLHVLLLDNTQLDGFPVGLFGRPRPRHFYLDLRGNPVSQVAQVAPGSVNAELLARAHMQRTSPPMSDQALRQIALYTESVGLDPQRLYPSRGTVDSIKWDEGISEKQWQARQPIWNAVEDEFGSMHFFDLLEDLTETADFRAGGAYRADLTAKVWRMLEAMHEDAELRETLFAEASVPTNCRDGAIQAFNDFGIRVLVHEAKQLGNRGLIEAELVELAKGKSRIDKVNSIARKQVGERLAAGETLRRVNAEGNIEGTIDVLEVHLKYLLKLADRLDLPWQPRSMLFDNLAGVTDVMINDAHDYVIATEADNGLRQAIVEVDFWQSFIEATHRAEFKVLKERYHHITAFKIALDERAAGEDLTPRARDKRKEQLRILAFELGKPESAIAPGEVMTDEAYAAELASVETQINQLRHTLTQRAMDIAKVQREEAPW